MPHEDNSYSSLVFTMTTLGTVTDHIVSLIPANATILRVVGHMRSMGGGTHTVSLTNDTNNTLASVQWTGAGTGATTISNSSIAANDSIHVDISGTGIAPVDCSVTVWLKMGSVS